MRFLKIFTALFLLINSTVLAQNVNQLDENGKRHGIWKKNFDNTNVLRFEGEFYHGKEIGLFKFYQNINSKAILTATREFIENNIKAYVKFYASNGKIVSEGQMNDKIYVGEWKYYQKDSNQLLTLEHFDDNGNLTGERFVYYKNGEISQRENYNKGVLDGESVWYSENNITIKEFTYVEGQLHGPSKYYDPKGQLITEGSYKNGKKDGIWKYYENGEFTGEKNFSYTK